MRFYKRIIRTFHDLPGHNSMLIHSLAGCNLKCMGCHNYDELVANPPEDAYGEREIIEHIKQNGMLFDALIFSGGEFLLERLESIEAFLLEVRQIFAGIIILNSNGSYPQKIAALLEKKLVDGIHLDCKLPYHLLAVDADQEIYSTVLGVPISEAFQQRLLESVHLVIRHNSKYSQIRTVKYPVLDQGFFTAIAEYVDGLNSQYNSDVAYRQNDFVYIE